MKISEPVFFVGMPRSGTTIIFEAYAQHESVAWPSNYCEMWPALLMTNLLRPMLDNKLVRLKGNKKQYGAVRYGNRYLPQPDEAYAFWDRYSTPDFSRSYLLGRKASAEERASMLWAVSKLMRYQLKDRFAAKLTGPGRIGYLASIFEAARFVHVVRDGRSVVHSLMNVDFWRKKGGFDGPFWLDGFPNDLNERWIKSGRNAKVLAALQWMFVVDSIREEAKALGENRYMEIKYEKFIASPHRTIGQLYESTGLSTKRGVVKDTSNTSVVNMNAKYLTDLSVKELDELNEIMGDTLARFGYSVSGRCRRV